MYIILVEAKLNDMNNNIQFSFGMNFKSLDVENRLIEGFASTKSQDRDDELIPPEAFLKGIETYMRTGTLLYEHGQDKDYQRRPIGKVLEYQLTDTGLYVKARVSDNWIWEKIQLEELSAFSWGGIVKSWSEELVDGEIRYKAEEIDLYEVSIVSIPANPEAIFSRVKSAIINSINNNDMDKIQEMFENLNQKFTDFSEKDSKVKSLKEEKKALKSELEEKSARVIELEKELEEKSKAFEDLENKIKSLDEKMEALISEKKKSLTDEKIEVKEESVKSVDLSYDEIQEKFNKLINL